VSNLTTEYSYSIDAVWRIEPTSPALLGNKFVGILDAISNAAPKAGEWLLGLPPYVGGHLTISQARPNIAAWVNENVATMEGVPEPEEGYKLIALNMAEPVSKMMSLISRIGYRLGDSISFRVGDPVGPSDLETVTYALFRAAMLGIIAYLPPVWANAKVYVPGYTGVSLAPGVPSYSAPNYGRSWLSYLCAPLTEGLVPPVGVPCERTPDGGLLMVAAEERLDPTDPDHMRRSQAIAEVMIARAGNPPRPGYWPIDEEWPPTEEALRRRGPPAPYDG
jgi:hypothetical protein